MKKKEGKKKKKKRKQPLQQTILNNSTPTASIGLPPPPASLVLLVTNLNAGANHKYTSNGKEAIEEILFQTIDLDPGSNLKSNQFNCRLQW